MQRGERSGEPRAHRLGLARRVVVGGLGQRRDRLEPFAEDRRQRRALGAARGDERGDRLIEAVERAGADARRACFVVGRLDDLDDAAHRQHAVQGRRREAGLGRRGARGDDDLFERAHVEPRPRARPFALRGRCVAKQVPRASALASRARASLSMRSKPGGRRSLRSSPLALTHLISTVQRQGPSAPAAREKPVMLVSDMAPKPPNAQSCVGQMRIAGAPQPL